MSHLPSCLLINQYDTAIGSLSVFMCATARFICTFYDMTIALKIYISAFIKLIVLCLNVGD